MRDLDELRKPQADGYVCTICCEAADEIERLRAALGQPVPLSDWQKMEADRDRLRAALERIVPLSDVLQYKTPNGALYRAGLHAIHDIARAALAGTAETGEASPTVRNGWCSDCGGINEHYDHCVTRRAVPTSDATGNVAHCPKCYSDRVSPLSFDVMECGECGHEYVRAAVPADDATGEASRYDGHCRNCGASTKIDTGSHCPACYPPRASVPASASLRDGDTVRVSGLGPMIPDGEYTVRAGPGADGIASYRLERPAVQPGERP